MQSLVSVLCGLCFTFGFLCPTGYNPSVPALHSPAAAALVSACSSAAGAMPVAGNTPTEGGVEETPTALASAESSPTQITVGKYSFTYGEINCSSTTNWQEVFEVTSTSTGALTYQYKKSGGAYSAMPASGYLDAGSYTVKIDQAASDTHSAASIEKSFTVNKKDVTISGLTADNKTYDGTNGATIRKTNSYDVNGLVTGDGVSITGFGSLETTGGTFDSADAGGSKSVTVTGLSLSGEKKSNYNLVLPTNLRATINERDISFSVTIDDKNYDGTTDATVNGSYTFDNLASGDNGKVTLSQGTAKFSDAAVGTDKPIVFSGFSLSGSKAGNYNLVLPTNIKASINEGFTPREGTHYTITSTPDGSDGWYKNKDFTITAASGYQVSEGNADDSTWSDFITKSADANDTTVPFYVRRVGESTEDGISKNEISQPVSASYKKDSAAPTATIKIGKNSWTGFSTWSAYGYFFKETVSVSIEATDSLSGVEKTEYQIVGTKFGDASPTDIIAKLNQNTWTNYTDTGAFSIIPETNQKFAVYAKVTDNAGNVAVINTDGIVIYTDSTEKTTSITFTKTSPDDVTASVRLNGNTISKIMNGDTSLEPNKDYEAKSDGRIIFKSDYLDSLTADNSPYTFTIYYNPAGENYFPAVNSGSQEPATTQISLAVYKANQSAIAFKDVNDTYYYRDGPITLAVEGGSGTGAVRYLLLENNTDCVSLDGAKITIHKPGSFKVQATKAGDENYNNETSAVKTIEVLPKPIDSADITIEGVAASYDYVATNTTIEPTITVNHGGKTLTEGIDYDVSYTQDAFTSGNGTTQGSVTVTGKGNYTGTKKVNFEIKDKVAPTGTISIKNVAGASFTAFNSNVTFDYFFKSQKEVTIGASDNEGGIKAIYYSIADQDLFHSEQTYTKEEIENAIGAANWKEYTAGTPIPLTERSKNVIYVKLVDHGDNVTYLNTAGIVVYQEAKLTPNALTYTKRSDEAKAVSGLNGNTVNEVQSDSEKLTEKSQYTVQNDRITFTPSYLESLAAGTHSFTISCHPMGVAFVNGTPNEAPTESTITLTVEKATLTADLFTFTPPANLTYDAATKEATVKANGSNSDIGAITVKYCDSNGAKLTSAPVTVGTYTVKIDVAQTDIYNSIAGLTDAAWQFTITKATPVYPNPNDSNPESVYGKTLSTVALPTADHGAWAWDDPDALVGNAGQNTFPATFTPNDTANYESVPLDVTVIVKPAQAQEVETPNLEGKTILGGTKLSGVELPEPWQWSEPDAVLQTGEAEYMVYCEVDDKNYDWAGIDGYNATTHRIERKIKVKAVDPKIVEGQNGKWTQSSGDGLKFRSNAEFKDFVSVSVDGVVIDGKNYTVKEGSTIVTLKPDYLATLSVGKHTLSVNSTTGSAPTEFEIKAVPPAATGSTTTPGAASEPAGSTAQGSTAAPGGTNQPAAGTATIPHTGDSSHPLGWMLLAVISGGAILALAAFGKKRKALK